MQKNISNFLYEAQVYCDFLEFFLRKRLFNIVDKNHFYDIRYHIDDYIGTGFKFDFINLHESSFRS